MIRSYLKMLLGLFAVLGLTSTMVACGEPLDNAPLNQLSKPEQEAAATRIKTLMIKNLEDKTFTDALCNALTVGFMAEKGTQAVCEKAVVQCKADAGKNIEQEKGKIQKKTTDFSKCDAKFSEVYSCLEKSFAFIKSESKKTSCADAGKGKKLGAFEQYAPECKEIMKKCGTAEDSPAPKP